MVEAIHKQDLQLEPSFLPITTRMSQSRLESAWSFQCPSYPFSFIFLYSLHGDESLAESLPLPLPPHQDHEQKRVSGGLSAPIRYR